MKKLKDRKSIDQTISKNLQIIEAFLLIRKRNKKELKRLKKCTQFLRGFMRTHTHLPHEGLSEPKPGSYESEYVKDGKDMRPQFFVENSNGEPALVKEFLAPNTENLLPMMPRISLKEAARKKMKCGVTGIIVHVCPFHDKEAGHKKFIVDFNHMRSEPFDKKSSQKDKRDFL